MTLKDNVKYKDNIKYKGRIIFFYVGGGGWGVGGCNFSAEHVSKNFLPPCRIHFKNCPPLPEDEGYLVVSLIGYVVTVGHC